MHLPVLLEETVEYLAADAGGLYVDCTLGGGGHLKKLLTRLNQNARIIAIDQDEKVLNLTRRHFSHPGIRFIHGNFRNMPMFLNDNEKGQVDGIMIDLGVSSFQLDTADRGFSFHEDSELDMRMDTSIGLSARDIVNDYSVEELSDIIFKYGEEKFARSIARAIELRRRQKEITGTLELVEIIKSAVPAKYKREKHPARRTFQALRIAVNDEMGALEEVLPHALDALKPGGRICVITFHSLEDRLVKTYFKEKNKNCICPPDFPVCTCNHRAELKILTRRPVVPSAEECELNPRARSAKLRVAEKL